MATQINDSQIQYKEQTFEFSIAVKTEHMVSAYIEDLFVLLIPISLKPFEALTCYNTFLKYHNLPLLNSNQTIGSFMKYLKRQKFTNLTRFSINKQLNEAYIYLPHSDNILPNHTILNHFTLSQYYNTPLKSFRNIIIPELDDNLNISNPITNLSTLPNTNSTITNPSTLPNTNSTLYLNIIIHNVQGFNVLIKRQL